jgi:hypothetical protein
MRYEVRKRPISDFILLTSDICPHFPFSRFDFRFLSFFNLLLQQLSQLIHLILILKPAFRYQKKRTAVKI